MLCGFCQLIVADFRSLSVSSEPAPQHRMAHLAHGGLVLAQGLVEGELFFGQAFRRLRGIDLLGEFDQRLDDLDRRSAPGSDTWRWLPRASA